jgi:hypothetical protein
MALIVSGVQFAKIYPNWDFWFENIPSGNPVLDLASKQLMQSQTVFDERAAIITRQKRGREFEPSAGAATSSAGVSSTTSPSPEASSWGRFYESVSAVIYKQNCIRVKYVQI